MQGIHFVKYEGDKLISYLNSPLFLFPTSRDLLIETSGLCYYFLFELRVRTSSFEPHAEILKIGYQV